MGSNREDMLRAVGEALKVQASRKPQPTPTSVAPEPDSDPIKLFAEELESVGGKYFEAENEEAAWECIDGIVRFHKVRSAAVSDGALLKNVAERLRKSVPQVITPPESDAPSRHQRIKDEVANVELGITSCAFAVAETGTLVLSSTVETNRLISLLPPVHITVLPASRLVPTLGEAFARLRSEGGLAPVVTLITGPSRTADIELSLTIGVHGPKALYVILLRKEAGSPEPRI